MNAAPLRLEVSRECFTSQSNAFLGLVPFTVVLFFLALLQYHRHPRRLALAFASISATIYFDQTIFYY